MNEPQLRRAGPADAGRLSLLGGATFLLAFAHDHPGDALVDHVAKEHSVERYSALLADPDCAIWLVETTLGAPIAYAVMTPPEVDCAHDASDLELKRIYVLDPWRGGGWGETLISAVQEEARHRGARRLLLCVYTSNLSAQRFYARQGFADTGYGQQFYVGAIAFDDRIWAKAL